MLFFTSRRPTSRTSKRADRTAGIGFWDDNAKDESIKIGSVVIGYKTSLNFKINKGDEKIKTEWIMHEYRLSRSSSTTVFDDLVLCRIYDKKKKLKNNNGQKRSRGQEEAKQSMSKKMHAEEEKPAFLPSSSSSASCHMIFPLQTVEERETSLAAPANDGLFLEEALSAPDDGLFLENVEWDDMQISLEDFLGDLGNNKEL